MLACKHWSQPMSTNFNMTAPQLTLITKLRIFMFIDTTWSCCIIIHPDSSLTSKLISYHMIPNEYMYILWFLGDNPPHDVWNETLASQLTATDYTVNYVASKLPNTTIYPAMGNHGKGIHTSTCWFLLCILVTAVYIPVVETWPESEYIGTLPQYQVGLCSMIMHTGLFGSIG